MCVFVNVCVYVYVYLSACVFDYVSPPPPPPLSLSLSCNCMYSCMSFFCFRANPGCLGNMKEFQMKFERPILEGQKFDCTKRELATARSSMTTPNNVTLTDDMFLLTGQKILENLMSLWVLRRTKTLISSQLPKKGLHILFYVCDSCEWCCIGEFEVVFIVISYTGCLFHFSYFLVIFVELHTICIS